MISIKSKILTKKTMIDKIYEGLNDKNAKIIGVGVFLSDIIKPLIDYIEKNTDIEIH